MAGPIEIPLGEVIDSLKDLETVKETDKCVALLPRAFRALCCGPEMWIMRRNHNVRVFALELEKELLKIDPRKIIEPPLYVAFPALQAVSYSMDSEELRNMYIKLLASAMNSDTSNNVHPAFVDTIKQTSPFEAQILHKLKGRNFFPYLNVKKLIKGTEGSVPVYKYFSEFDPPDCVFPQDLQPLPASIAISNLARVGLVSLSDNQWLVDDSYYKPLITALFIKDIENLSNMRLANNNGDYSLSFDKCSASVTPFGKSLIMICLT